MKYIEFTYVDRVTRISIFEKPAMNGPDLLSGIEFKFALESQYPTTKPLFYGTCADDFDLNQSGVLRELTQVEFEEIKLQEFNARKQIKLNQLNQAWQSKLNSGFEYQNIHFDTSDRSMMLIANAAQSAIASKVTNTEFTPITWYGSDNQSISLNADQLIDFHSKMTQYGEVIFSKYLEIEESINNIPDNDFTGLSSVSLEFNV